jgi:hypothetical protein
MSLLGAKRPQHGVWQLIVASLAIVVSMPALSAALIRPGSMPDVHIIGRSFLAILAVVGWMNFVGTRQGLAATLLSGGMIGILALQAPAPLLVSLDANGDCVESYSVLNVQSSSGDSGRTNIVQVGLYSFEKPAWKYAIAHTQRRCANAWACCVPWHSG